ncbi:MAG: hypothetical protein HFJ09_09720 [Lachnospiraceae bacterium]|nr:hypothetical protein [Lachnospiraceae bacterium]
MTVSEKYAKNLEGITYLEWIKLKTIVDELFNLKKRELENDIQLSDANEITEAIHRQFG